MPTIKACKLVPICQHASKSKFVPLLLAHHLEVCASSVDLLNALLRAGQNGLPPTPNTLHLGCSYHVHSSHHFLSTWCAIMLIKIMLYSLLSTLSSFFLNTTENCFSILYIYFVFVAFVSDNPSWAGGFTAGDLKI